MRVYIKNRVPEGQACARCVVSRPITQQEIAKFPSMCTSRRCT